MIFEKVDIFKHLKFALCQIRGTISVTVKYFGFLRVLRPIFKSKSLEKKKSKIWIKF